MATIETEERVAHCAWCNRQTEQWRDVTSPPPRWHALIPRWIKNRFFEHVPCEFQCLTCEHYWPSGRKLRHY